MNKSEIQVLDFEKICRLCLLEKRSMSAIFSKKKSDKKVPLPVRIMSCASLQLYEGDGLPASICNKCLMSVNQSYAFREQCEQADTTLRQYAQRLTEANEEASTNPLIVIKEIKTEKMEEDFDKCDMLEIVKDEKLTEESTSDENPSNHQETENWLEKLFVKPEISVTWNSAKKSTTGNSKDVLSSKNSTIGNSKDILSSKNSAVGNSKDVLKKLFQVEDIDQPKYDNDNDFRPAVEIEKNVKKKAAPTDFFSEYAGEILEPEAPNKEEKVRCKECNVFVTRRYFNNHVKFVHKKLKDHLCQICGYRGHGPNVLREHMESKHSGVAFPCSHCSRVSLTAKRLALHVKRYHSGKPLERRHVCQYCGYAFAASTTLTRHVRVHTDETPYACSFCEKKFKYRWAWKSHEHLHTGVKPYKCTYCGEAFTQNCVRKNHEYRVHGNEEFNPKNRIPKTGIEKRPKRAGKSKPQVQAADFAEFVTKISNDDNT